MAKVVNLHVRDENRGPVRNTLEEFDEDIAAVLGSLANRRRLQLLSALYPEPRSLSHLREVTGLGKTALAHHLGSLVKAGLLERTGRGHYELTPDGRDLLKTVTSTYATSERRRELEAARRADHIRRTHAKERERTMQELDVRIVGLEPMRVASVRAVSETPERDAWAKMRAWAEPKGLLKDMEAHPVFGFNNPDPSPGSKEYGYEFWIRIGPEMEPEGDVEVKEFEGGLYAVTECNLKEELESEFFRKEGYLETWKRLTDWVTSSQYEWGKHPCLEKSHDPKATEDDLILDLYCPIEE
jgi:DNA gyrase inhibitor GyrI/DNA-binding HxlR family transcriptional regulator